LAVAGIAGLGVMALFGWHGRELPHVGGKGAYDQSYMRRMVTHHAQGIELAHMAGERAGDPHLRALARLMAAAQRGEVAIFDQWWRSWFDGSLAPATPKDHAAMPGMLAPAQIEALSRTEGARFEAAFVELMTIHHRGAIAMADEALTQAGDPRLKLMSHAIRHEQRGEIALMQGTAGLAAVQAAIAPASRPAGQASSERRAHDPAGHRQATR
jgi:uncharacterized protein (DUF305 family)